MTHSEQINEIAGALAKAQGAIRGAAKDSLNPHFKNRYADLASVWEACREQLAANGIAVVQAPGAEGATVSVETLLVHSSGQWFKDALSTLAADARAQSIGSAITYLRRYALAAMVGVAPEDDDGEAAEGRETQRPQSGNGSPQSRAEAVKARVQQQTQEAIKSPAFRKQEVLNDLKKLGLDVRAEVAHAIGRTIPAGEEIKITEPELVKLEAHVTLRKAEHNQGRAAAH